GDRRRWKWPCPHCDQYFEGTFQLLKWSTKDADGNPLTNLEKSETVRMVCPHCGCEIDPVDKYEMNLWGMWVPEGCHVNELGQLAGVPMRSSFASFWLRGTAAAFITWQKLVLNYLDAM
ncbi:phage terminase large subunit family protein, partial [Salmonella enterica subsp. enterica serovar Newport]